MTLAGAILLFLSISPARNILRNITRPFRRKWLIVLYLIVIFIFGYLLFDIILISSLPFPVEFVTGGVFFGGAIFVYIVMRLAQSTITAQQEAEKKRLEMQRQQKALLDNIPDMAWLKDKENRFIAVNEPFGKSCGLTPEDLVGKTDFDIWPKALAEKYRTDDMEVMQSGKRKQIEEPSTDSEGKTLWIETIKTPIYDDQGNFTGTVGIARDITVRARVEKALRLSEERFRRIFDEGPLGMMLANSDYSIIAANKAFSELLGYTKQELTGRNIADITYEEDREKSREFARRIFFDDIPVIHLEKRYVRKDGQVVWANITTSAVRDKEGDILYALVIAENVTDKKKAEEEIRLLHYYDSLTGLPNRTFLRELTKKSVEHARRYKETFAVIFIGLDNFYRINNTLGYKIGDLLLKTVTDRLLNALRKSDYVARSDNKETENLVSRVGGDRFIVLAHDLREAQDAAMVARRLLREISIPYDLNGHDVFMTASIGIALYPNDGTDVDNLLENAEKAMRHSKKEGQNNYQFYSEQMNSFVADLLILESDLHKALERGEFVLYYQPKVDAVTRTVTGMEALIRWNHPEKGLIPPMEFIPLAETNGLILPIGKYVIRTACKQIKAWMETRHVHMNVALNVSGRQFDQQNLIEIVKDALQDAIIPAQYLTLEITESIILKNPERAIQILTELKAMGLKTAIDDFGTGYSSLNYLKQLPLDFLKIDQSFVKNLASDLRDQAIVRATIAMAHSLDLKTIAEGVETEAQMFFLREHGCDEIQGFLFGQPLPAEQILEIFDREHL
jgi:diguanylate cyclase (GGDEF)-like protein/PAS domain S-box-containing protein